MLYGQVRTATPGRKVTTPGGPIGFIINKTMLLRIMHHLMYREFAMDYFNGLWH